MSKNRQRYDRHLYVQALRTLLVGVATVAGGVAQLTWGGHSQPVSSFCYDPLRDRVVGINDLGTTYEYDNNPSMLFYVITWTGPQRRSGGRGGVAYAPDRQRVVCDDDAINTIPLCGTWEWDGTTWSMPETGRLRTFEHVFTHWSRGKAMALATELYDWNGTTWTVVPTNMTLPRPTGFNGVDYWERRYLTVAHDRRRDKLVVFGSGQWRLGLGGFLNRQPTVWEWDPSTGWVSRTVAFPGTLFGHTEMHFDATRGTLVVWATDPSLGERVFEWDGGTAWQVIVPVAILPSTASPRVMTSGFDSRRGRLFTTFIDYAWSSYFGATLEPVNPAIFEHHGWGCPGTLGEPQLRLRQPWTRAWLGGTLEVDLANLPHQVGLLAVGLSAQQHGTTPLPFALDNYGMPGCSIRVSPDLCFLLTGSNQVATVTAPVPNQPALIGLQLYAQGASLDPAANAGGWAMSNSVRLVLGNR